MCLMLWSAALLGMKVDIRTTREEETASVHENVSVCGRNKSKSPAKYGIKVTRDTCVYLNAI